MLRSVLVILTATIGIMIGLAGLWILLKEFKEYKLDKARLKIKFDFVANAPTQYLSIHSLGRNAVTVTAVRYFIMPHHWWEKPFKGLQHSIGRWLYRQEFTSAIELVQGINFSVAIELPSRLKLYNIYKAQLIDQSGKRWSIEWPSKALAEISHTKKRREFVDFAIQPKERPPRRPRSHAHSRPHDPYSVSALLSKVQNRFRELWLFFVTYPQRQRDKMRLHSVAHFDFETANLQGNTITIQSQSNKPVTLIGIRYFIMPQGFWKKLLKEEYHHRGRWLYNQELPEKIHLSSSEQVTVTIDLPAKIKLHRIYRAQIMGQSHQRCEVEWASLSQLAVFTPKQYNLSELLGGMPHRRRRRRSTHAESIHSKIRSAQQSHETAENDSHLLVSANFDFDTLNAANNTITIQSLGKKSVTISRVRYFITPHGLWRKLFRHAQHRKGRWLCDQDLVDKINLNEGEQTTIKIDLPSRVKLPKIYKAEVFEQTHQRWQVSHWPSASKLAEFVAHAPAVAMPKPDKTQHRQRVRVRKRKVYAQNDSTLHGEADFAFVSPTEPQHSIQLHATGKAPLIIEIMRYYIMPRSKWKRWFKNWQHRKGLWLFDQELRPNIKVMEGEMSVINIKLPSKIKIYNVYKVEAIDHLGRHWVIEWPTRRELSALTSIEQLNFFERKNDQRLCRTRGFRLGQHFYLASQFGTLANATEQLTQRDFWLTDLNSYQDKYQDLNEYQCKQFLKAEIDEIT